QGAPHGYVLDARIHIDASLRHETVSGVEILGMQLRGKHHFHVMAAPGLFNQGRQQHRADSGPAAVRPDRHPADMRIGQQAAGSQRPAPLVISHGMHAVWVMVVHFEFRGHMLLHYEDLVPYGHGVVPTRHPIAHDDLDFLTQWNAPLFQPASFRPMIPRIMKPTLTNRGRLAESPNRTIPNITVPTAPIPTQTA